MPTFREDPKLGSKVPMIKTADLNEQCVTNSKILDGCITKEKLAKGTVDSTTLANKSVGTEKLSDSSVTNEKISNKAVSTEKLADGSITKEKIFNASITTEKLANESVSAEKLQSGLRNTIASTYDKTIELDNQKANIADVGNAIERLENKIGERFIVEGDVTNLPDEEDLTSVSTIDGREVMKLNDRAYEPSNFSGKGYKILRKNIKKFDIPTVNIVVSYAPTSSGDIPITVNDKVTTIHLDSTTDTTTAIVVTKIADTLKSSLDDYDISVSSNRITLTRHNDSSVSPSSINVGNTSAVISVTDGVNKNVRKNVLTDSMIGKPNTIYEIKYDFDLNGKEITIPKNCILEFRGGNLRNGTIVFDGTVINAGLYQIFYNVITKGYSPSDCQVEWFGAKAYNKLDTEFTYSSDGIQHAIDSCFKNIFFNIGVYYLDKTLEVDFKKSLNFKGSYNGTVNNANNYAINNTNASTLCVLTDIDILHINCKYEKTPNDIDGFISIRGYGVLDATKVDNYNSVAVKINVNSVIITKSNIDLYIVKKQITVNSTEEAKKEDFGNSIGIELNNSSTVGYSIYGLKINGRIQNFRYGIKNNIPVRCFPTAMTFNCQINRCVTAIDFGESGISGSQVFGEIQSGAFFTEETRYKYPLFTGQVNNVYFDCYVWDLGLLSSKNVYLSSVVMNIGEYQFPIFGEMFKTFLPYITGCIDSKYSNYKNTDFLCPSSSFKSSSTYFVDFLTDDYAFHHDYTIDKNGININGSPFNYGTGGNNGLYVKPVEVDNGKSFKITLNTDKGLTKLFIEYVSNNNLSYFESVDIIYYNKENKQIAIKNYKFLKKETTTYLYIQDVNIIYGNSLHHIEIIFNNLTYVSKDSLIFFIRASGFRHDYNHINTPNRTVINEDGTFILQGDEYKSISTETESYLLNKNNNGKIYSTAGRQRYSNVNDILNTIQKNTSAYGNGCRFYMYNFTEPKTFIYDKSVGKLFRINMVDSDFKERGTFKEKPQNPYIGYQFFCTDKQTQEGATDGIVIYYKGNNVWVDALGRVIS